MMRFVTIFVLTLFLAGCIPPDKPERSPKQAPSQSGRKDRVALEVSGEKLTIEQIRERQESMTSALPTNSLERQLTVISDFELLADAAEKAGYGRDPRVVSAVKDDLARQARERGLKPGKPSIDVDEAAVKRAFEAGRKTQ